MPSCYRLIAKDGTKPLPGNKNFIAIDEAMCKHFDVTPDENLWYQNWENVIGISLATGKTWDDILAKDWLDEETKEAIKWLADRYEPDCWYQVR